MPRKDGKANVFLVTKREDEDEQHSRNNNYVFFLNAARS